MPYSTFPDQALWQRVGQLHDICDFYLWHSGGEDCQSPIGYMWRSRLVLKHGREFDKVESFHERCDSAVRIVVEKAEALNWHRARGSDGERQSS